MRGDIYDVAGDALSNGDWATLPLKNRRGYQYVRHPKCGGIYFLVSIWKDGKPGLVISWGGSGKRFIGGFASIEAAKAYADKFAPLDSGAHTG